MIRWVGHSVVHWWLTDTLTTKSQRILESRFSTEPAVVRYKLGCHACRRNEGSNLNLKDVAFILFHLISILLEIVLVVLAVMIAVD